MNPRQRNALMLGVAVSIAGVGLASYQAGMRHGAAPPAGSAAGSSAKSRPLYWYDPMVPAQHFEHGGKSPFMDMQLVAKYADDESQGQGQAPQGVRIAPDAAQNLGVRTAEVVRGRLPDALSVTGVVDFNGRDVSIVQPRTAGFVQRVYGRAPGDVIPAGAPIVDLLVPEWGGAQAEYLAVQHTGDAALTAASRQRLRLLGMPEGLIDQVARTGRPVDTITVRAPNGGVIQKLDVRAGMTVTSGQTLAEVNGLGSVWVTAAVPEAQAAQGRVGQSVSVTLDAYPGETFSGRVQSVLPQAEGDSRTISARIELPNRQGRLRPGMFATVSFAGPTSEALLVPTEALIRTGRRTLAMLALPGGRYQPVEVKLGQEAGGQSQILAGLSQGDRVIVSGQFLIDSEASLSDLKPRPLPGATGPDAPSTPASVMSGPAMSGMSNMTGMSAPKGDKP